MSLEVVLLNVGRVVQGKGGCEKVFCEMANALVERGMKVHAVCCEDNIGLPAYPLLPDVHFVNAGEQGTAPWYTKGLVAKVRTLLTTSRKSRRCTRSRLLCQKQAAQLGPFFEGINPDVIVAFQPESAFIVNKLLKLSHPLVTVFHNAPERFIDPPEFGLFKDSVLSSDFLSVLMPEYKIQAQKALPGLRVEYVPNAIAFPQKEASLEAPLLITVGRADAQKRHLMLVEAFERLKGQFPDWRLDIWGETQARYGQRVLKEVDRRNLKHLIRHKGLTDNVQEKLLEASVFAFPSAYEGFSLALGEAMSVGLPAVGCIDCPSVNTLIRSGENGLLTEPTVEAFAEGLATLMRDVELRRRLGRQAREDMRAYAPEKIWSRWVDLLEEVSANAEKK